MYCCLGTVRECTRLNGYLPQQVIGEILRGLAVLDAEFGVDRNYFETGGYSVVADSEEDLYWARKVFDDQCHKCEWATRLGGGDYISVLYLLNNEYSVMLYTKESLANDDILANLEI